MFSGVVLHKNTRVHETQVRGPTSTSDSKPQPERAALVTCDPSVVLQCGELAAS